MLSRLLGPVGIGQWSMLIAVSNFFHTVFLNWTQAPLVRFGREEWLNSNDLSKTWSARRPLIFIGLAIAVLLLAFRPFSFFERLTSLPSSWWLLAVIYLIGLWFFAELQSILTVTTKLKKLAILPLLCDILIILFLLVLIFSPNNLLKSWAIVGIVVFMASFWGVIWAKEFFSSCSFNKQTSLKNTLQVCNFGWPIVPAIIFTYLIDWGDHFLLQHFRGSYDVGSFHVGYQLVLGMMNLTSPLLAIFIPKLININGMDRTKELDYLRRVVPSVVVFWLLAIIPCIAIAPWIFEVAYGEKFSGGLSAFYILCIMVPGAIFTNLYYVLFNVQGRLGRMSLIHALTFIVNISISLLLIPRWGILGAAIGTIVANLFMQYLYIFDQHKFLGIASSKVAILFLLASFFSLIQFAVGGQTIMRVLIAMAAIWVLIMVTKKFRVCDGELVAKLLPNKFAWVGQLFDRLLRAV